MRLLASFFIVILFSGAAFGEEVDCLLCHEPFSQGKTVHPAVLMGCMACHTGIDATDIPHKKTNTVTRGLSAEPPELCFTCHDKTVFEKNTVHPALLMGCTTCHNPHSTETPRLLVSEPPELCYTCHDKTMFSNSTVHPALAAGCTTCHNPHSTTTPKLLVSEPPDLCYTCHDKAEFSRQNVHMPVAAGMCTTCHNPHSTEEVKLLSNKAVEVCLQCHGDIKDSPHAIMGFSATGHPIGNEKTLKDPARLERVFYCGSCHNPHSSDSMRLFRYKAASPYEICINCHKK